MNQLTQEKKKMNAKKIRLSERGGDGRDKEDEEGEK